MGGGESELGDLQNVPVDMEVRLSTLVKSLLLGVGLLGVGWGMGGRYEFQEVIR